MVICLIAGAYLHKCQSPAAVHSDITERKADTLKVYDTIPYYLPHPTEELAVGSGRYTLPTTYFIGSGSGGKPRCIGDSATMEPRCIGDSATFELPIIQRHYSDSTYEAWVSGPVDPQLDSLQVNVPTTIITEREWKPPKRWHIGPTVGYGYTPQGFQPYIGVSITYSIISL